MANNYEWNSEYEFAHPSDWSEREVQLYGKMAGDDGRMLDDRTLQLLYNAALFEWDLSRDQIESIRAELERYLYDQYGLDLDDAFDWDAYKRWYESTH